MDYSNTDNFYLRYQNFMDSLKETMKNFSSHFEEKKKKLPKNLQEEIKQKYLEMQNKKDHKESVIKIEKKLSLMEEIRKKVLDIQEKKNLIINDLKMELEQVKTEKNELVDSLNVINQEKAKLLESLNSGSENCSPEANNCNQEKPHQNIYWYNFESGTIRSLQEESMSRQKMFENRINMLVQLKAKLKEINPEDTLEQKKSATLLDSETEKSIRKTDKPTQKIEIDQQNQQIIKENVQDKKTRLIDVVYSVAYENAIAKINRAIIKRSKLGYFDYIHKAYLTGDTAKKIEQHFVEQGIECYNRPYEKTMTFTWC